MITIVSECDEQYPDIRISDGTKSFLIKRMYAADPYWIPDFRPLDDNDDIIFVIDKKDGYVFTLFVELYKNVISGNVFPWKVDDLKNKSDEEKAVLKGKMTKDRKKQREFAKKLGLINNGVITWHSDDHDPFEFSAILTIKKKEDQIEIIFSKNKVHEANDLYLATYAIRISESGSRYHYFFAPFVVLHRQLQALVKENPNLVGAGELTKVMRKQRF